MADQTLRPDTADDATAAAMVLHYAALAVANNGALIGDKILSTQQFDRAVIAAVTSAQIAHLLDALRLAGADADTIARSLYEQADGDGQALMRACWYRLEMAGHDPVAIAAEGARVREEASAAEVSRGAEQALRRARADRGGAGRA